MGRICWRLRHGAAEGSHIPKLGAVNLFTQIKIDGSWKLAPALFDTKGRVRCDHVRVQARDQFHEEGIYYLEWWSAGKRTREPGGPDAFVAAEKARCKHAEMSAIRSGVVTPATPSPLLLRRFPGAGGWHETCSGVMGLTKMDWNNNTFYKKLPVTLVSLQHLRTSSGRTPILWIRSTISEILCLSLMTSCALPRPVAMPRIHSA